jgi:3-hydroxybutyryl-CoA dehydrogenase
LEVDKLLAKDVSKQRITQDEATKVRERLTTSTKLEDLDKVDFVIEAVPVSYAHSSI